MGDWAESGTIGDSPKPPFDFAGPMGDGSRTGSYAVVTDEQARTGTKAIKLYQVPPTKSDAQRRVTCREYSNINKNQFYWSWWAYFPDNMGDAGGSGQWTNLGGLTIRYGPLGDRHKYRSGTSFYLNDANPRRFYARWHKDYDAGSNLYWSDFYLNSTYLNKWMHFQIYARLGNSSDGVYRMWIGDGVTTQLLVNLADITNDPRSDSRWQSENLSFAYPPDGFYAKFQLYQPTNSPERWFYVDDVVLSCTKVSETYRLGQP